MLRQHGKLTAENVRTVMAIVHEGPESPGGNGGGYLDGNRSVRPRTDGQARYVRAMRESDLTLCVGPAGSGKTYLGVAMGVSLLRQGQVKKIVLVRPGGFARWMRSKGKLGGQHKLPRIDTAGSLGDEIHDWLVTHGDLVHPRGQPWQLFTDGYAGHAGGDSLVRAADAGGGRGLHVESVEL